MTIAPGTAIATFDADGRYGNHTDGRSHAAIYLGQDASGIQVLDQWVGRNRDSQGRLVVAPKPVSERTIKFLKTPRIETNGDNYYVVD